MHRFVAATATAAAVAALSLGFAGAASAADLPMYAKAPMMAPYNWSGFYVGGDVGWQTSSIAMSSPLPLNTLTYDPRHSSVAAGVFGGYQRQFGALVLGIEGGYLSGFNNVSLGATPSISIFQPGSTGTAQAKLRDIWSFGGRLGWGVDNWMPYVTGGYANGRFELDSQDTSHDTDQVKANTPGAYVGVGVDWAPMRSGLIVGLEYRHYAFGTTTAGTVSALGTPDIVTFDPKTDTVLARFSYKFGN
jgi:outer membrane immunogenic protein